MTFVKAVIAIVFPVTNRINEERAGLIVHHISVIKELIQSIDLFLFLALTQFVHELARALFVRGIHVHGDEWTFKLVRILVTKRHGAVGFAPRLLGKCVIKVLEELLGRHGVGDAVRTVAENVGLIVHILGGPFVVGLAIAALLALQLAGLAHLGKEESGRVGLLLALVKFGPTLIELVGAIQTDSSRRYHDWL